MATSAPPGPVMLGLTGIELSTEEPELLCHPQVGGVILFSRNYQSPEQVAALTAAVNAIRPELLIAVDHEGGRVQRFRAGFTALPAMRQLGRCYDRDTAQALTQAEACGWLLASELRAVGVDFSFAPVLDLDYDRCPAIGDRALHHDPQVVSELALALQTGMREAGMATVGKHFPGHGAVDVDSHLAVPVDDRGYDQLAAADLIPFGRLIEAGLAAVLPAHVVYRQCDPRPAGFSPFWLQTILRQRLGFQGAIFSDDLDMAGAGWAGSPPERAQAALAAGCDMVLACNDRAAAVAILERLDQVNYGMPPASLRRLAALRGGGRPRGLTALRSDPAWRQAHHRLALVA